MPYAVPPTTTTPFSSQDKARERAWHWGCRYEGRGNQMEARGSAKKRHKKITLGTMSEKFMDLSEQSGLSLAPALLGRLPQHQEEQKVSTYRSKFMLRVRFYIILWLEWVLETGPMLTNQRYNL